MKKSSFIGRWEPDFSVYPPSHFKLILFNLLMWKNFEKLIVNFLLFQYTEIVGPV